MNERCIPKILQLLFVLLTLVVCSACSGNKVEVDTLQLDYPKWDLPFHESRISAETMVIVNRIAKVNKVMGIAVGSGARRPKQYDNFVELKKNATKVELVELTNHPKGVVRCYAFWALACVPDTDLWDLLENRIKDPAWVDTLICCSGGWQRVGDLCIDLVTEHDGYFKCRKLSEKDMNRLFFLLTRTPNQLSTTRRAVDKFFANSNQYGVLRTTYVKHEFLPALVEIAGCQKEQDINLVLNALKKHPTEESMEEQEAYSLVYKAVARFPDPAFFPLLEEQLRKIMKETNPAKKDENLDGLYNAIAAYKNKMAEQLLHAPLHLVKQNEHVIFHLSPVFKAVNAHKCPIYDGILWEFWEKDHRITPEVLAYLNERDPERAYQIARDNIAIAIDPDQRGKPLAQDLLQDDKILPDLVYLVAKWDRPFAIQATITWLQWENGVSLWTLCDIAEKLQDASFIEPLFHQLQKQQDLNCPFRIAKALLSYNDSRVNQRLLKAKKSFPSLQHDWTQKDLTELFQEHGLIK